MGGGDLAAYVLTCGSPELTRRTLESVSWAAHVELVDVREAPDLLDAAAQAASVCGGWSLVLLDGEVVDRADVERALRTGTPSRRPVRLCPASIAGGAARLDGPRLFAPGELGDRGAGRPAPSDGSEAGAPWHLEQVPLVARVGDDGWAGWARRRAVLLSREQLHRHLGEDEALQLAELLLLARERDAVVVRARTALAGGLSRRARARWCELGLAAAVSGPREAEAVDFAETLLGVSEDSTARAVRCAWAAVAAERVLDFSSASARWREAAEEAQRSPGEQGDPWMHVVAGRRGTPQPEQVVGAALAVRDQRPTGRSELAQLVELWRAAGLPAEELLGGWPPDHVDVLVGVAGTATGSSPAWRLGLLEGLYRSGAAPRDALAGLAAPLASRTGADEAVTWTRRCEQLGLLGPAPLQLRAQDPFVSPGQRVLAAVLWWRGRRTARAQLLERVVSRVHPEEVEEVLTALDHAAGDDLPHVLELLCRDPARALAVERLAGAGAAG